MGIKLNPETRNLIRKARGPRKALKERLDELEDQLGKENPSGDEKKPMSPIQINPDEHRWPVSARSDQKLITSDEEMAARDENKNQKRRGPRRGRGAVDRPEIMETNLDEEMRKGQVNPAFEATGENLDENAATDSKNADTKPKKKVRRAKKMTDATTGQFLDTCFIFL